MAKTKRLYLLTPIPMYEDTIREIEQEAREQGMNIDGRVKLYVSPETNQTAYIDVSESEVQRLIDAIHLSIYVECSVFDGVPLLDDSNLLD
jgi:hypothetical protein